MFFRFQESGWLSYWALNDENIENLVMALKCVTEAKGGIAVLVEKTGLSRQTIYNTFSLKTSPNLSSFNKILNALGFEIKVVPIQKACWL